jgi:hypothetical protein
MREALEADHKPGIPEIYFGDQLLEPVTLDVAAGAGGLPR